MRVVLVASALAWGSAVVSASGFTERRKRAAEPGVRRTGLPQLLGGDFDTLLGDNTTHAEYTSNWAGAVLIGTEYKTVSGTIVVPKPSMPAGGISTRTYSASAWVGIDGSTCQSAILQTGVDFSARGGTVTYEGWYEWYPDYSYRFSNFKIAGGDTITMTVIATSKNSGSVTLDNRTTGQSVTHTFTNQVGNLCHTNAEWIVEDFSQGNSLVPFANFGTVAFTNASANGVIGLEKAVIYDIKQGNKVYTSCSSPSPSSVTCSYVG
ncbi:putative acid proteinase protein [Rosellinia necatrix]|uniref:Putative acid proteinase protein n=1 Tax=Rosellinia necatrix TaxID=77044 RepID=A0A1W2TM48_ROSNE|nr:putative acid proteinase protein [Rosellinia necatrix]